MHAKPAIHLMICALVFSMIGAYEGGGSSGTPGNASGGNNGDFYGNVNSPITGHLIVGTERWQ